MTRRLLALAYTLLGVLLTPLWLAFLSVQGRLRFPLVQRLGGGVLRDSRAPRGILFHAASAGDVRAVAPVIRHLCQRRPDWQVVCTTQTQSGLAMSSEVLPPTVKVVALPIDAWPWIDRFVTRLEVDLLVLEYLELWPRLMAAVTSRGGAIVLQNARLHPSKRARYLGPLRPFFSALVGELDYCSARTEGDAKVLRALGAEEVVVHPHTKHALLEAPKRERLQGLCADRGLDLDARARSWLAGSVHRDEAKPLFAAQRTLRKAGEDWKMICVPRYPADGAWFAEQARAQGLSARRVGGSAAPPRDDAASDASEVVIIESVGELSTLYGAAALAFVGGTLGARGGQNPLEAAVAGCTLMVGPHSSQIEAELEWLGGSVERVTAESLATSLRRAFEDLASSDGVEERESSPCKPSAGATLRTRADTAAQGLAERIIELAEALR